MSRIATALLLTLLCRVGVAADDFKVIKLEQDVVNLQRRVDELSRQLDQLRQRSAVSGTSRSMAEGPGPTAEAPPRWLSAANWQRVHPGMSELEVIEILGPPASVRTNSADARTLLYAMELGPSAFLGGSVAFAAGRVVDLQVPILK